jgi:hypothetical protein
MASAEPMPPAVLKRKAQGDEPLTAVGMRCMVTVRNSA